MIFTIEYLITVIILTLSEVDDKNLKYTYTE